MDKRLYMIETEEFKATICSGIFQKKISQTEAAATLGISIRQIQRLLAAF